MKQYSISAMPQLKRMTNGNDSLLNQGMLCNFKWLYHANVMNTFEQINNNTV